MIKLKNLTKKYDNKIIFENLSLEIPEGKVTAFSGVSGIGKTTLLRCIAGLEKPDEGKIEGIEGKKLSYIFQENRLIPNISAEKNLLCVNNDKENAERLLKAAGLYEDKEKTADTLSGGMKRRLAVIRALHYGGDIFFFDEPLRELDAETSQRMLELVKTETLGKTVLLITHSPADAVFLNADIIDFTTLGTK